MLLPPLLDAISPACQAALPQAFRCKVTTINFHLMSRTGDPDIEALVEALKFLLSIVNETCLGAIRLNEVVGAGVLQRFYVEITTENVKKMKSRASSLGNDNSLSAYGKLRLLLQACMSDEDDGNFWQRAVVTISKAFEFTHKHPSYGETFTTQVQQMYEAALNFYHASLYVIGELIGNPDRHEGRTVLSKVAFMLEVADSVFYGIRILSPETLPDRIVLGRELRDRM